MNERIKELYKQSFNQDYFPRDNEEVYMSAKDLEKFAKLIIEECVEIADEAFVKQMGHMKPGRFVKEHFGVE
jgi:hypothetical protein